MRRSLPTLAVAAVAIAAALLFWPGCHPGNTTQEMSTTPDPGAEPNEADLVAQRPAKGGAQLWSENCIRCHNYRRPRERSDREWTIIVHHMRVRANLTAREHREILAFLQAAN